LRERSLSAYYDEVAIKGLQLAAIDVVRGSVTATQLARIEATTNDLVDGLDAYDDIEPAPLVVEDNWSAVAPLEKRDDEARDAHPAAPVPDNVDLAQHSIPRVLCIPGRGPLDPLATTILLQLLGKHGLSARSLPHEAASRASIDTLDADDVDVVCILCLQVDGLPSHLRYLVRRIRARLPKVSIVIGLWPQDGTQTWRADLQDAMGAECYATSLRDVLAACRKPDAGLARRDALAVVDV
jgi:hypothetical protein